MKRTTKTKPRNRGTPLMWGKRRVRLIRVITGPRPIWVCGVESNGASVILLVVEELAHYRAEARWFPPQDQGEGVTVRTGLKRKPAEAIACIEKEVGPLLTRWLRAAGVGPGGHLGASGGRRARDRTLQGPWRVAGQSNAGPRKARTPRPRRARGAPR